MLFFVCLVIHSISASSCMMMHCTLHSHLVFISSPSSSIHVVGLISCFCPHAASVSRTVVSFCVVKDLHWSHWSHWSIIPSCPSSCTGPLQKIYIHIYLIFLCHSLHRQQLLKQEMINIVFFPVNYNCHFDGHRVTFSHLKSK